MTTTKVVAATFKTAKAIEKELVWWLYVCPELNPTIIKLNGIYHVVRDFSSKDHPDTKTIEVAA
jgi:hypothetical protein